MSSVIKHLNMSGSYSVDIIQASPNCMEMDLDVMGYNKYKIFLYPYLLTIEHTYCGYIGGFSLNSDVAWIPRYMVRTSAWGRYIYATNPAFIMKLWGLVADKSRLLPLRKIIGQKVQVIILESMKTTILISDGGTTIEIKDIEYVDAEHLNILKEGFQILCKTINVTKTSSMGETLFFMGTMATLEVLISLSS
jgi:hypothetical protein